MRWQNSKRLIYGSLVCLSCDLFESFLFATVSNREPKELEKGRVEVIFTEESISQLATVEVGPEQKSTHWFLGNNCSQTQKRDCD